jgi:hypothetical protein
VLKRLTSYLCLISLFTSCVENSGVRTSRASSSAKASASKSGNNGQGAGAVANEAPDPKKIAGTIIDGELANGRAEIRHIVDPFDGTFKKKLTIPRNFSGMLFLSGLNIASLRDRIVKVRFNFGREMESVTIPATVGRAPGLTPQTDIQVLIMDVQNRPFENIRLLYDLFDYNDYRDLTVDGSGAEVKEPTIDPRDNGLYCRGLKLEHDPTFQGTATNTLCDSQGERCLFAYAKIADAGLFQPSDPQNPLSTLVAITPTEAQIDLGGGGFNAESTANKISKCLPDNMNRTEFNDQFNLNLASLGYGTSFVMSGKTYKYNGPFRAIASDQWEVKTLTPNSNSAAFFPLPIIGSALYDSYPAGIFKESGNTLNTTDVGAGIGSFLFPRRGKMSLQAGIEYFGSENEWGDPGALLEDPRNYRHTLVAAGETRSMYGCNIRVSNYDEYSNEGIGSCNVTGNIEIIALENGIEVKAATAIDVKLQLIRPSLTNFVGREVLYTSMKSCSTSRACGSNECCFNERCWDRNLVTQCLEDAETLGNYQVGETCESDYECASLCCDAANGRCTVHNNLGDSPVLCSKSPGQTCIAREWCRKDNVTDCFIVQTGTDPTGKVECALRCYSVPTHGSCLRGTCVPPNQPAPPAFDPSNPNCSSARLPPSKL